MNIIGTICEYNPFHNGHLYQLRKIKEIENPDILIVVLSSYFTMRGDLSLHLPKTKARYALNECDIVISLPSVLACNNATRFADYAVLELNKLKVNKIYCGSESNDINLIKNKIIDINQQQKNKGENYKKFTQNILNLPPNDLLAYSYLKAIYDNKLNIELKLIKRIGDGHEMTIPNDDFYTSSSAIRTNLNLIDKYCPNYVSKDILNYELLFPYFKYMMFNYNDFDNILFINDGIHKHLLNNLNKANSFKELIKLSTNSYFTKTKIKRAIFYLLFNIEKTDLNYKTSYILGFNNKGKEYLNNIKKDINIITNNKLNINNVLNYEIKIANILSYIYNKPILNEELNKPIII